MSRNTSSSAGAPSSAILTQASESIANEQTSCSTTATPVIMAIEIETNVVSTKKTAIVIACITYSTGITTFLAGLVTMAIPVITEELNLPANLELWPVTVYSLTCACTLLICGSISDVIGSRLMFLLGCFFQGVSTLACGLAKTGTQMIVFRAFSGVAASFCLPSAVSLINEMFPPGQSRNVAFASMGGAQPVGFGIGLVLGGVITGTVGWKWGFFIAAISNILMLFVCTWQLPKSARRDPAFRSVWKRLSSDIDWVGVNLASAALAIISYVIAVVTESISAIQQPQNICLLILSFILFAVFVVWVGRQERLGLPALIPNSLWTNKVFTCTCVNVFLIWAAFNAFEQYQNFFFQEVQHLSPLDTALRFLPAPISGALTNVVVGLIIHRVRADWIVIITTILSGLAPVLMAVAQPSWSYWACAFLANFLNPIGADGIFTISNLLITSMFPPKTQGVAGGVFNTVSQTGKSIGLALTALVANKVTRDSRGGDKLSPEALLAGYQAAFWFCVALTMTSLCISIWGLRRIGKVGRKAE
ncbi:integral membrane protein [Nannizzia gypsea CBS 118893]|uniref:Integral membrane protein n=1 Tax=Arthroderma gypseum (strain ATCC MYA-4604 / CBS 118893) TaxID=535722 RepID=E4UPM7_ARTGP|nr:integral membrane protein [Nannizzia gypsea CBS 118893]EFQ99064.1 integral membrane protein [Nannizzia gypsea CBS 118893]